MDALSRRAYAIYLLHYVFVAWCQYLLLDASLPAAAKFAIVFGAAIALSWLGASLALRVSFLRRIL